MDHALMARKLAFIQELSDWLQAWHEFSQMTRSVNVPLSGLALERLLQLAVESVTDVGHMLIDCFMMRDPGSYEDIIEVLYGEGLFDGSLHRLLLELVRYKGMLSKTYEQRISATELGPFLTELAARLPHFTEAVRVFMKKEFGNISSI